MNSRANPLPMLFLAGERTWEMPQLPALNKLPPHAAYVPYGSLEQAAALDYEHSPWYLALSGTWEFMILDRPLNLPRQRLCKLGYGARSLYQEAGRCRVLGNRITQMFRCLSRTLRRMCRMIILLGFTGEPSVCRRIGANGGWFCILLAAKVRCMFM